MKICSGAKWCPDKNCHARIPHEYVRGVCLTEDRAMPCIMGGKVWCKDAPQKTAEAKTEQPHNSAVVRASQIAALCEIEGKLNHTALMLNSLAATVNDLRRQLHQ